jgi:hypothetical protein
MPKCNKCSKPMPGNNDSNTPWLCRVCKEKVTAEKHSPMPV